MSTTTIEHTGNFLLKLGSNIELETGHDGYFYLSTEVTIRRRRRCSQPYYDEGPNGGGVQMRS